VKVLVSYSFEIELPEEVADSMPELQAKELARELAQNINFQEVQRAYTRHGAIGVDVYITKIRSTRIEDW
jgi:hypothetical protein